MKDLRNTRKFKNRKKWATAASIAAVSIGLGVTGTETVYADNVSTNKSDSESINNNEEVNKSNSESTNDNGKVGIKDIQRNESIILSSTVSNNKVDLINEDKSVKNNDKHTVNSVKASKNVANNYNSAALLSNKIAVRQNIKAAQAHIAIYEAPTDVEKQDDTHFKFNNIDKKVGNLDLASNGENKSVGVNQYTDKGVTLVSNANDQYTFKLADGWEIDQDFTKWLDPDRMNATTDHGDIFTFNSDNSITFNFNNLPKEKDQKQGGRFNNQAYQLFVKKAGQRTIGEKELEDKGILKAHTNSGILNWFDDKNGTYLGSTILRDYSMGLGIKREENLWKTHNLQEDKDSLEVEHTKYHFSINKDWVFAYDDSEYGEKGYVTADPTMQSAKFDLDFQEQTPAFTDPHSKDYNGDHYHFYRLFVSQIPKFNDNAKITTLVNHQLTSEELKNGILANIKNANEIPDGAEYKLNNNFLKSEHTGAISTTVQIDYAYTNNKGEKVTYCSVKHPITIQIENSPVNVQIETKNNQTYDHVPAASELIKNRTSLPIEITYVWQNRSKMIPDVTTHEVTGVVQAILDNKAIGEKRVSFKQLNNVATTEEIPLSVSIDKNTSKDFKDPANYSSTQTSGYTDATRVPYFVEYVMDKSYFNNTPQPWTTKYNNTSIPSYYIEAIKSYNGKLGSTIDLSKEFSLPDGYVYAVRWVNGGFKASPKVENKLKNYTFNVNDDYTYKIGQNDDEKYAKGDISHGFMRVYIVKASDKLINATIKANGREITVPGHKWTMPKAEQVGNPAWDQSLNNQVRYGNWNTQDAIIDLNKAGKDIKDVTITDNNGQHLTIYSNGKIKNNNGISVADGKVTFLPEFFTDNINSDTPKFNLKASYFIHEQTVAVKFVDDQKSGEEVASQTKTGKTGQTIELSSPNDKYELVSPSSYTFKAENNAPIIVHLKHATKAESTSKSVVRDIIFKKPTGIVSRKQIVTVNGTKTIDKVTGDQVGSTNWQDAYFEGMDVPNVTGYVPSVSKIERANAKDVTTPLTVTVSYTAGNQTVAVKFVDDQKSGEEVGTTHNYAGETDKTISLNLTVPVNYVLADNDSLPQSYTFKAENNAPIIVHLKHATENVTNSDENAKKVITRTITVNNPDGQITDLSQHVILSRIATKDLVTNKVKYGQWNTGKFNSVSIPVVENYIALVNGEKVNTTELSEEPVDINTLNQVVVITYVSDKSDVSHYNPEVSKDAIIGANTLIDKGSSAQQFISNFNSLPKGTTAIWTKVPDTIFDAELGEKKSTGIITINYPDKTTVKLPITVKISAPENSYVPSEPIFDDESVESPTSNSSDELMNQTERIISHNAYVYNKNGERVGDLKYLVGTKLGTSKNSIQIQQNGEMKQFYQIGDNEYVKVANFIATKKTLTHNAYIYESDGITRVNNKVLQSGKTIYVYESLTINGKKYYRVRDGYVKVANFEKKTSKKPINKGVAKKLRHNAFIYNSKGKRVSFKLLKKHNFLKVYETKTIHGKKYYRIGKNQYVKVANFE